MELLFATKQDLETLEVVPPPLEEIKIPGQTKVAPADLEAAREAAVRRIESKLGVTFMRRGKALRAASDGKARLVCIASQKYHGSGGSAGYWYGFTPAQKAFLDDVDSGYVAIVCGDSGKTFLASREEVLSWLPHFLTTPPNPTSPDDIRHWHIILSDYGDHIDLIRAGGGIITELSKHVVSDTSNRR